MYREKDLEEIARQSGYCFENFVDVTEGLDRVAYEGVISEVVEQQLNHEPDYISVPFGAGILCNEVIDYVKKKNLKSKVIPVSSGNPNTIAIMLYGPIWVDADQLLKNGKAFTKHDTVDRKGLIREPYLVYNVNDDDILSAIQQLKTINLSCEPSGASGFAMLQKLNQISPDFNPDKHSVLVINTGNGFLNY